MFQYASNNNKPLYISMYIISIQGVKKVWKWVEKGTNIPSLKLFDRDLDEISKTVLDINKKEIHHLCWIQILNRSHA